MRTLSFLTALLITGASLAPTSAQNTGSNPDQALEAERRSQSGVAITIIFDDSGSMAQDNKMPQAKSAFVEWLGGIPAETKLSLITLNKGTLIPLQEGNREAVAQRVAELSPGGGTPLTRTINAVRGGIEDRRKSVTPYERHIVVVFTDGEDSEAKNSDVVRALQRLSEQTIESTGIGFHGQGDYMASGATQYFNADDSKSLVRALNSVASEIDQSSEPVISPEIEAQMDASSQEVKKNEAVSADAPEFSPPSWAWAAVIAAFFLFVISASLLRR